jgi:hypothetical protein
MEILKKYVILYMYQKGHTFYLVDYDQDCIEWSGDKKNCLIFPNEEEALKAIEQFPWFVHKELCVVKELVF